jgi:hypothetical protein
MKKLNSELLLDDDRDEEIKFPTPASKHTFCGVCQSNYQDYVTHIKSLGHLACVEAEDIYSDIDELIVSMDEELGQKLIMNGNENAPTSKKIMKIKSL